MGFSLRLMDREQKVALLIHAIQFVLVHGALVIGIYRVFNNNIVNTRADTWILGVSGKSIVVMFYMVLTEYVDALRKFHSVKANMILSIVETVFWIAAFVMPAMNLNKCVAIGCTLTAVVIGLAVALSLLSLPIVYICFRQYMAHRRNINAPAPRPSPAQRGFENKWVSSDSEV